MTYDYDVIIVGASVGGATAALALGSAGYRIGLFESRRGPKRKACGCGLSAIAFRPLCGLGVFRHLSRQRYQPLNRFRLLHSPMRHTKRLQSTVIPAFRGIGIAREQLDCALLNQIARTPLVTLHSPTRIRTIEQFGHGVRVRAERGYCFAPLAIVATGATGTLVAGAAGRSVPFKSSSQSAASCMMRSQMDAVLRRCVTILCREDYGIFFTPISATEINIAFVSKPGGRFPFPARSGEAFFRRQAECAGFEPSWIGQVTGSPNIHRTRRTAIRGGILTVGDACCQLDPAGGMGMTFAVESALAASSAILRGFRHYGPRAGARLIECNELRAYDREVKRILRPLRLYTHLARVAVSGWLPVTMLDCISRQQFVRKRLKEFHARQISLRGRPSSRTQPVEWEKQCSI